MEVWAMLKPKNHLYGPIFELLSPSQASLASLEKHSCVILNTIQYMNDCWAFSNLWEPIRTKPKPGGFRAIHNPNTWIKASILQSDQIDRKTQCLKT